MSRIHRCPSRPHGACTPLRRLNYSLIHTVYCFLSWPGSLRSPSVLLLDGYYSRALCALFSSTTTRVFCLSQASVSAAFHSACRYNNNKDIHGGVYTVHTQFQRSTTFRKRPRGMFSLMLICAFLFSQHRTIFPTPFGTPSGTGIITRFSQGPVTLTLCRRLW
jgi:hypothetical protein